MASVNAKLELPFPASVVEALWYDPARWPSLLDGFGQLSSIASDWPQVGSRAIWDTNPGGRGRVVELVTEYEARVRCVTEVEDDTIRGIQMIEFAPRPQSTLVQLTLEYEIKDRNALTPVIDLLFIRRTQRDALQRTLRRLGIELRSDAETAHATG